MPTRPPRAYPQGQPPRPRVKPSPRTLGYDTAWDKARAEFLKAHPRCECPEHKGKPNAPRATVVDHVVPHKGNKQLLWSTSNWQSLTASCHGTKTGKYDRPESRKR